MKHSFNKGHAFLPEAQQCLSGDWCCLFCNLPKLYCFVLSSILLISFQQVKAQQLLNGNMEDWDTAYYPIYPTGWLTNGFYAALPCYPPTTTAERSNDSYEGNWAAKLEAKGCVNDLGQAQIYIGFLVYGSTNYPYLAHGIPYEGKPDKLSFYYKYHKEGNDTAFASIKLRLLDSAGRAGQVIGQGYFSVISETTEYTQADVPIAYTSLDTPQLIQIVFSTSKTLTDKEFLSTNYGEQAEANIGSTLWIDNIVISSNNPSNNVTIQNHSNIEVFPNPVNSILFLRTEIPIKATINLINYQGKTVITEEVRNTQGNNFEKRLDISMYSKGVYFLKIETSTESTVRKIIIQ